MAKEKTKKEQSTPGAPEVPAHLKKTIKEDPKHEQATTDGAALKDDVETSADKPQESTTKQEKVEQIIDSKKTDDAVADIVRKEGDELLDNYDQNQDDMPVKTKKSWWKSKGFVWTIIVLILAAAIVLMAIPQTRYAILNALGVRVSASLTVVDKTTNLPLRNVTVELAGNSASTNADGYVSFEGLKQGPQNLKISRVAFSTVEQPVTLGWGSNPLGSYQLTPSGSQYTFVVRDALSNKPIESAEVTSGEAVAKSDKDGKAVLTLERTNQAEVPVTVSANNYRAEEMSLAINTEDEVSVSLMSSQKAVFVSSTDGKYNVYSMYIDGQDRQTVLEATGNESSDIALAVSPDGTRAAVVSTRDNIKNEDGSLLETVTLVDINKKESQSLDRVASAQLIDWIGTILIYQITSPGAGQESDDRQKIISYDYSSGKRVELATANNFTSVASAQGAVYFGTSGEQFFTINPDGTGRSTVINANIQHAYRTNYDTLTLQADGSWYSLSLSSGSASQTSSPASTQNRIFITDQDGKQSLWVNGNTLNVHNIPNNTDNALASQGNLSYPVRWLANNAAIFRDGGADFAISTNGGDARKIADVITTTGLVQAY